jgi:hypothetical protein
MKRRFSLCVSVLFFLAIWSARAGTTYYVAPVGSDNDPGTFAQPWRTVQKAADTLQPGDVLLVRTGTYREQVDINVSGSETLGPVTFANRPGERPVLDATGLVPPDTGESGLFQIEGRHHVVIRGFEVRNYKATDGGSNQDRVPCGILVRGTAHHIEIRNNVIHDIWNHFADGNAFGIAVYGDTRTPMQRIVVDGNQVHHCRNGNSETIAINGNVTDFEVTGNRVYSNTNIGIVCIGFEGTCPDPTQDRARNGVVARNVVWGCTSTANPAYDNQPGADGIYVDGGTQILVERNLCHQNDIGIELASEHFGRTTDFVTVRNNFVWRNKVGGIFLGGYAANKGGAQKNVVRHNTLWRNDTRADGNGEICLQHNVYNNTITHNICWAGLQSWMLINPFVTNSGNTIDYNLWFAAAGSSGAQWQWRGVMKTGFGAWQTAGAGDAHGLFANPLLVHPSGPTPNLHLRASSPAVDRGDPSLIPAVTEGDIDGQPRLMGLRVDLGADEFGSP